MKSELRILLVVTVLLVALGCVRVLIATGYGMGLPDCEALCGSSCESNLHSWQVGLEEAVW